MAYELRDSSRQLDPPTRPLGRRPCFANELKKCIDGLIEQRDEVDGIDGYRSSGQKSTSYHKESLRLKNGEHDQVELAKEVRTVGALKAALARGVALVLNASIATVPRADRLETSRRS